MRFKMGDRKCEVEIVRRSHASGQEGRRGRSRHSRTWDTDGNQIHSCKEEKPGSCIPLVHRSPGETLEDATETRTPNRGIKKQSSTMDTRDGQQLLRSLSLLTTDSLTEIAMTGEKEKTREEREKGRKSILALQQQQQRRRQQQESERGSEQNENPLLPLSLCLPLAGKDGEDSRHE